MKYVILSSLLLLKLSLAAQTQKGAQPVYQSTSQPVNQPTNPPVNQTRAVVVGISDYQHNAITDLKYAHRDAEAFAAWLRSPAGGSVPGNNITVLTNEQATAGQLVAALDGLVETSSEGETIVIYFSGHGDIEKITIRQNGYLLCHDAPATGYPAGGALSLGYLQDIVSTLSEKRRRVVLVTDACHAGKLAGSAYNGTQTTNAALAKQFAGEVKIMSCQATELALEGEQWGGGRGLFSFYLVDGLAGFADKNADGAVSLLELGRYLEDHVAAEAAPHPQTPVVLGDRSFPLARVDAAFFADRQKAKSGGRSPFSKTEMRGLFSGADSLTYQNFQAALGRRDFLEPADNCAEFFFQKLLQSQAARPMQGLMRRNYAAALQDEIQQAINALLDNDPYENNNWRYSPDKYHQYPALLARAIELLGEGHYFAPALRAKKAYFEGYSIAQTAESNPARRDSLREAAKRKYLEAIGHDPDAPYPYFAIGYLYLGNAPYRTDSVELWCSRALERAPGWVTPALEVSFEYKAGQANMDAAEKWLMRAEAVLPNSYLILERKAWLRQAQGRRDEVVELCEKMIAQKPDLFNGYGTLGRTCLYMDGDYVETEMQARKAIERNPDLANWAYTDIGAAMIGMRRTQEAIAFLENCLETSEKWARGERLALLARAFGKIGALEQAERSARQVLAENLVSSAQTWALFELGKIRVRQNKLAEGAKFFEKSLAADPTPDPLFILDWAWLGEVARLQGKTTEAKRLFQKALGYTSGLIWEDLAPKEEAHYLYGHFLLRQNRLSEAQEQFQKSLDIRKKGFWGEYGFALLAARAGKKQEALDWLEKSLDNFYPEPESILVEPLFAKLRKTNRFRELLAKHFPETSK